MVEAEPVVFPGDFRIRVVACYNYYFRYALLNPSSCLFMSCFAKIAPCVTVKLCECDEI